MQRPQITHDAAFKFALWQKLWADTYTATEGGTTSPNNTPTPTAGQQYVDAQVRRAAFPLVRGLLPRRTHEPCCLCASCFPARSATGSSTLLHSGLHPGRRAVAPAEAARDEDCFCLAHAAACLGAPTALLSLRGYRSSAAAQGDGRDAHRGLRCLLRHLPLTAVEAAEVDGPRDGEEIARELRLLLLMAAAVGRADPAISACCLTCISLDRVAAPAAALDALFVAARRADCLVALRIAHSQLRRLATLAALLHGGALARLSLRGSRQVRAEGWAELAAAVAASATLSHLDVSECGWSDEGLGHFLAHSAGFVPRPPNGDGDGFSLDLSRNALTGRCWLVLADAAPDGLRASLTALALAGTDLRRGGDDGAYAALLRRLPALASLDVGFCTFAGLGGVARLARAVGGGGRPWARLDLQAPEPPLAPATLRRLAALPFHPGRGALVLCGADLRGDGVGRMRLSACLASLSELNLNSCRLTDEGLGHLAAALDRAGPLPALRALRVGYNALGAESAALPLLCRALRAGNAPALEVLDLSHNGGLTPRPVLALIEQAAPSLRELRLSMTPVAERAAECAMVVSAVMRRQRGAATTTTGAAVAASGASSAFSLLDLYCANAAGEFLLTDREVREWLWRQTAVRFISQER